MTTTDTSNAAARNAVGKLTKGSKPKRRMARPANAESEAQADPAVIGDAARAPTLAKPDCPSSEHLAQSVARISGVLVSSEG